MIHYGNLKSLQKFELITEEYKSITGKKGISLRILNFITKNQNSLRKILISLRQKYFITEKGSIFRMNGRHRWTMNKVLDHLKAEHEKNSVAAQSSLKFDHTQVLKKQCMMAAVGGMYTF